MSREATELLQSIEDQIHEADLLSDRLMATAETLTSLTTDETPADVLRRALGIYQAAVHHAAAGGKVLFKQPDGTSRALKIPLRRRKPK